MSDEKKTPKEITDRLLELSGVKKFAEKTVPYVVAGLVALSVNSASAQEKKSQDQIKNPNQTENVMTKELDGKQLYETLNEFINSEEIGRKTDYDASVASITLEDKGPDRTVWEDKKNGDIYIGGTNLHVTNKGEIMETYTIRKEKKVGEHVISEVKGVRSVSPDNKYLKEIPGIVKELSARQKEAKTFNITPEMIAKKKAKGRR